MGILACIAYGHLFNHAFGTDDFEHIADVEAILEDPTRLFSPEYHVSWQAVGRYRTFDWVCFVGQKS